MLRRAGGGCRCSVGPLPKSHNFSLSLHLRPRGPRPATTKRTSCTYEAHDEDPQDARIDTHINHINHIRPESRQRETHHQMGACGVSREAQWGGAWSRHMVRALHHTEADSGNVRRGHRELGKRRWDEPLQRHFVEKGLEQPWYDRAGQIIVLRFLMTAGQCAGNISPACTHTTHTGTSENRVRPRGRNNTYVHMTVDNEQLDSNLHRTVARYHFSNISICKAHVPQARGATTPTSVPQPLGETTGMRELASSVRHRRSTSRMDPLRNRGDTFGVHDSADASDFGHISLVRQHVLLTGPWSEEVGKGAMVAVMPCPGVLWRRCEASCRAEGCAIAHLCEGSVVVACPIGSRRADAPRQCARDDDARRRGLVLRWREGVAPRGRADVEGLAVGGHERLLDRSGHGRPARASLSLAT